MNLPFKSDRNISSYPVLAEALGEGDFLKQTAAFRDLARLIDDSVNAFIQEHAGDIWAALDKERARQGMNPREGL